MYLKRIKNLKYTHGMALAMCWKLKYLAVKTLNNFNCSRNFMCFGITLFGRWQALLFYMCLWSELITMTKCGKCFGKVNFGVESIEIFVAFSYMYIAWRFNKSYSISACIMIHNYLLKRNEIIFLIYFNATFKIIAII